MENIRRASEIGAIYGTAAVYKNPKAALSTIPDNVIFLYWQRCVP